MAFSNSSHYGHSSPYPSSAKPTRSVEEFDTSETIEVSSFSLISMLKHARSGVPVEVMGLMLGEHVDKYTVRLSSVFSMPQVGTGVNVESIDEPFLIDMTSLISELYPSSDVNIGWYHSHPGFGCWLSSVDLSTHSSFEMLDPRAIAIVVDPIKSVKGKVVIDAFRSIDNRRFMGIKAPRLITSTSHFEKKPTMVAMLRGLTRLYYSIDIQVKVSELEKRMLLRVAKKSWVERLQDRDKKEGTASEGQFDFDDIRRVEKSKAQIAFEELEIENSGDSSRGRLLQEGGVKECDYLGKEIKMCEKDELRLGKDRKYVFDFVKNKEDIANAEKEIIDKYGERKDGEKVSVEDMVVEAQKKIMLGRVGKINPSKNILNRLKIMAEDKHKRYVSLCRLSAIFGNSYAQVKYKEVKSVIE